MPPALMPASRKPAGLAALLEAFDLARDADCDAWDLALELSVLMSAGCSVSQLRWLMSKGFVEHGVEYAPLDNERRFIRKVKWLKFEEASCFVLSQAGADIARSTCPESAERELLRPSTGQNGKKESEATTPAKPHWNAAHRRLTIGKALVKTFFHPAPNQELALTAFEEDDWPERIDDPLPPSSECNTKCRHHDTINSLNRNQTNALIHFSSDANGQGIRWTLKAPPVPRHSANGRKTNGSKKKRRRKS